MRGGGAALVVGAVCLWLPVSQGNPGRSCREVATCGECVDEGCYWQPQAGCNDECAVMDTLCYGGTETWSADCPDVQEKEREEKLQGEIELGYDDADRSEDKREDEKNDLPSVDDDESPKTPTCGGYSTCEKCFNGGCFWQNEVGCANDCMIMDTSCFGIAEQWTAQCPSESEEADDNWSWYGNSSETDEDNTPEANKTDAPTAESADDFICCMAVPVCPHKYQLESNESCSNAEMENGSCSAMALCCKVVYCRTPQFQARENGGTLGQTGSAAARGLSMTAPFALALLIQVRNL